METEGIYARPIIQSPNDAYACSNIGAQNSGLQSNISLVFEICQPITRKVFN